MLQRWLQPGLLVTFTGAWEAKALRWRSLEPALRQQVVLSWAQLLHTIFTSAIMAQPSEFRPTLLNSHTHTHSLSAAQTEMPATGSSHRMAGKQGAGGGGDVG